VFKEARFYASGNRVARGKTGEPEGTQPQDAMKKKLDVLQRSFKQLEH
jgi:hypothetical protein